MKMILKTALGQSSYSNSWIACYSYRAENGWSKIGILKSGFALSNSNEHGKARSSSWQNSFIHSTNKNPNPFTNWIVRESIGTVIANTKAVERIEFTK